MATQTRSRKKIDLSMPSTRKRIDALRQLKGIWKNRSKKSVIFAQHPAKGIWKSRRIKDAASYALKLRRQAWAQ